MRTIHYDHSLKVTKVMIYIKTMHQETLTFTVDTTEVVGKLREMIKERLERKIENDEYKLVHDGKLMESDVKMLEYDIVQESIVMLIEPLKLVNS